MTTYQYHSSPSFYPYVGVNCEVIPDMCQSNPCKNGGTCSSEFNPATVEIEFVCDCEPGYLGELCLETGDPCLSNPCRLSTSSCQTTDVDGIPIKPGFEKVTLAVGYVCNCDPTSGATGVHCDEDINECESNPCTGGACTNLEFNQNFICNCNENFVQQIDDVNMPPFCDTYKDACKSNPCKNNGLCSSDHGLCKHSNAT